MSYILDALKKAERDRGLARVPTVMTVHELREARRSRWWGVAVSTIICAAAAVAFLLLYPRPRVQSPVPLRASFEPVMSKPSAPEIQPELPRPVDSPREERPAKSRALVPEKIEPKAVAPATASAPPAVSTPAVAVKPELLKEAAEKMSISILVYEENSADRLVFINGIKYVEGDYVDGTYLLKSITPEGAILTYEKEEFVLRPGSK